MTNEKLKFLGSTISKLFRYLNKNVIQARIFMLCFSLSMLMIAGAAALSIVLYAGSMTFLEFLHFVNSIIS